MTTRFHSALYRGDLVHARHDAFRRAFTYPVFVASLDLDELPVLDRELALFSYRGRNVFSFDDRDFASTLSPRLRGDYQHSSSPPSVHRRGELQSSLAALRAANDLPRPHASRLVTNLRAFGYVFNPVSFVIDYDRRGEITNVIAEVNNTYGGRLRYVLGPSNRLPGSRVGFRHRRELFVSPFLHGDATYDFWFDAPLDGSALAIEMHVVADANAPAGARRVLTARLAGARCELSNRSLVRVALQYPAMTAQIIGLIHYQALKLRLAGARYRRAGVDHRPHPGG